MTARPTTAASFRVVMAVLMAVALAAGCGNQADEAAESTREPSARAPEPGTRAPRPSAYRSAAQAASGGLSHPGVVLAQDLPPLPAAYFPAARPPDVVKAAYLFAARHPDVLDYVPCFCGCENAGHRGNTDCFVHRRGPHGVTAWTPHGAGWTICIDVARDANQLHNGGLDVAEIRRTIESRYRSRFPSMTPAPLPPAP